MKITPMPAFIFIRNVCVVFIAAMCLWVEPAISDSQTTLEKAQADGFIRIGISNEAPFAYVTEQGKLAGEAPEIAGILFPRIGIPRILATIVSWNDLIPDLLSGKFDVIAAGMFITPERCKKISFSEPTYGIGQAFLVRRGNPKKLVDYGAIRNTNEATLGVMKGTAEKEYARESGIPVKRIKEYVSPAEGLRAVQEGSVDAFALTALPIANLVEKAGEDSGVESTPPFAKVGERSVMGHGAFALRPDDQDLRAAINGELSRFIGTAEHISLVTPYGFGQGFLPQKTATQLCDAS